MKNYFKDKKFQLLFLDQEGGFKIQDIPRMIWDDEKNKSCVIAARGSAMSSDHWMCDRVEVRIKDESTSSKQKFKDVLDHICSLSNESFTSFMTLNAESKETIESLIELTSDVTVERLLLLVESDGSSIEGINSEHFKFCEIRDGGPELVIDFLLSKFCHHMNSKYISKVDPSRDIELSPLSILINTLDQEQSEYEEITSYDLSNHSTFHDLIEYDEDTDEGQRYKSSPLYYYYSVNLKAVERLEEKIDIPYRVEKILTEDQKTKLADEVPSILANELDYIAQSVLMQNVDSYSDDQDQKFRRMQEAQWSAGMYEAFGGDGQSNAYLGDGISITPTGKLVDD
jgi:hypothetical protein